MIFLHLAISLSDKVLATATVGGKVGRLTNSRYRFGCEMDAMALAPMIWYRFSVSLAVRHLSLRKLQSVSGEGVYKYGVRTSISPSFIFF